MKDNLKRVIGYLYVDKARKAMSSPAEIMRRVRLLSDFVQKKVVENPSREDEYSRRHWLFCDAIRKSPELKTFDFITPEDLGLGPCFPARERVVVGEKQKPVVTLRGVRFPLCATRRLGLGSFGVVKDGLFDGRSVAIKRSVIGTPSAYDFDLLLDSVSEAQGLLQLPHPNIVRCFGFFTYGDGKSKKSGDGRVSELVNVTKFAMVLERVRPMHSSFLEKLPLRDCVTFFCGLAEGLSFLHEKGVVHGDFKTINSGMGLDGIPKLLDFGFWASTAVREGSALRCASEQLGGTYPPPEAIAQRAACLIRPFEGKSGPRFAMKAFTSDPELQSKCPPYEFVPVPEFTALDLTKLDVFAFGVAFYDAIKVHLVEGADSVWPSYMTSHSNLNFLRDKVIMNGKRTRWVPNPVFEFLETSSLFSDVHGLLYPESAWLFDVVKGCLSEVPGDRWSMRHVLSALRLGLFLLPVAEVVSPELAVNASVMLSGIPSIPSAEMLRESPWSIISTSVEADGEWDMCDT